MKRQLVLASLLSILSASLLQACGGGGSETIQATVTPGGTTPNVNSGSISAQFAPASEKARYQIVHMNGSSYGSLRKLGQAAGGAITTLNDDVLGSDGVIKDISGDATYAMGRWVFGTITNGSGSEMLVGNDNTSRHYVVVNKPDQFPSAARKMSCTSVAFTTPTDVDIRSKAPVGTASGSAELAFENGVATVSGAINVSAGGVSGSASLNGSAASTGSVILSGSFINGGAGAATTIGAAGSDVSLLAISYAAVLSNKARYIGGAVFRCR